MAAAYRANVVAGDVAAQVVGLNHIAGHQQLFAAANQDRLAYAAFQGWCVSALRLASTPAYDGEEAGRKIEALDPILDHLANLGVGTANVVAMLAVAVRLERETWGIPAPARHPH